MQFHWKGREPAPDMLAILIAVASEPEQELPVMAAMGQVVKLARNKIAIGPRHSRYCGLAGGFVTAKKREGKRAAKRVQRPLQRG